MAITKGYKQLLEEARAKIRTLTLDEAREKFGDPEVVFVDIRDVRELDRDGMIPGAFHAPRGMLEFWVDPESPYHREIFAEDKEFVIYCASAWRSSLATSALYDMGLTRIAQIGGGFSAWRDAGHPVGQRKPPE